MRPVWVNDWNDQKASPNKKRIKQWQKKKLEAS